MIRSVGIFSSKYEPVGIFSLWILTQVSLNIPTAYMILRIPARGYCTECISWNFYTLNSNLGYFEYSNYHRSQLEYSNCLYNIRNESLGILCPKICIETTLNISNPTEASYCRKWIGWNFQTQKSWNILTTTVASWNIPYCLFIIKL